MAINIRCESCGERVRGEAEQIGARCPQCRDPLYEDPRIARGSDPGQPEGSRCNSHPQNAAIGPCQRCGNFMCAVCRTRWHNQAICLPCVERGLGAQETLPAEARAHTRQAVLAIVFGIVAWVITLGAVVVMVIGMSGKEPNVGLVGLGFLALLVTPLPALLGVGQGAAAIRARGDHMILATIGLLLSGLHTGVVLGLFSLALVQNS